jgi:SAM-dependent methyltransferase
MSVTAVAKSVYGAIVPEPTRARLRYKRRYLAAVWEHWRYRVRTGDRLLAPPHLRFRVAGGYDIDWYLSRGRLSAGNLDDALRPLGKTVYSFRQVLDFGCGCGRMLRWMNNPPPSCQIYGTDIDKDAIQWDRKHLRFAQFSINTPLPPLPYEDGKFDLIYSYSVFTHLNEEYQFRWLAELKRVSQPGAILLLSVHGAFVCAQKGFSGDIAEELKRKGMLFLKSSDPRLKGLFPDFYQNAFHTKEYIVQTWSKYFEIVSYLERGIENYQDLVVLQKHQPRA